MTKKNHFGVGVNQTRFPTSFTMQFQVLVILGFFCAFAQCKEIRRIHEITEGPYQNYSGQPLVDLGGTFYYFESNLMSNWYGAVEFCRNVGLHLVSIETIQENDLILGHMATIGLQDMWTSGADLNIGDTFVWASTGKRITFSDWHPSEPSGDSGEDCINYWFKDGVLKWNDSNCYNVMGVICEEMCHSCTP